MYSAVSEPLELSKELIRSFYYTEIDKSTKDNSGVIVDDACYELLFVKEKNVLLYAGESLLGTIPSAFTMHRVLPPFRFEFEDTLTVFAIKLQPWANSTFISNELNVGLIALKSALGDSISEFEKELFSRSFEQNIKRAESLILSMDIKPDDSFYLAQKACTLIYQHQGNITVVDLASEMGMTRQRLNLLFQQQVKYSVKTFITLVKLRGCMEFKLKNPEMSLSDAAYEFGFYDQAHFIKSFKKYCGANPLSLIKEFSYSCNHLR